MQIDETDIGIKNPGQLWRPAGKVLPHIIIFLVNDGHFQIAAADVSNHFSVAEEIAGCDVDVVVIDAMAFRFAGVVEHPAGKVSRFSHIFHCSEPSFF